MQKIKIYVAWVPLTATKLVHGGPQKAGGGVG